MKPAMTDTELLNALDKWAKRHDVHWNVGEFGPESHGGVVVQWSKPKPGPRDVRETIAAFLADDGRWPK